MAKGDIISIDTNKLKTGLSRFNSAKTKFNNNVYGAYKNSYFKTSGNSQVAKLRKTSDTLYKNLKEMYNNIKTYTEDYIESIQDLENDLKNGKCSTRDQATMRAAINQLNAILDGADPDEIDINPKTGEIEFGSMGKFEEWATNGHGWKDSAFNINMDKFNAANASSVISYRDENGKLVKIEGYNSNERTMVMTAAMTNNMNYYRMVMNSNSGLKEKTANIYTVAYANSPAVMGFLEASNPLPVTLEKLIDVKYTKKQQSTVDASKEGLGYGAGYFGGMAFSFVTGGGLIGEKALGEGALKVIAKTGGKSLTNKKTVVFAVNRFSDVFSSAPLNISDSLKSSYDSSGKIDWKQFGKMMAVNTGSDIVFGGLLDGLGIGVGKLVSKSGNIKNAFAAIGDSVKNYNFHSKAGFMRIPGLNRDVFLLPKKNIPRAARETIKYIDDIGVLDKEIGERLYNMFKDDNYIYGIHRTPIKESADAIMDEGLILSGHSMQGAISKDVNLENNITFRDNNTDMSFSSFIFDIKTACSYKYSLGDKGYAMIVRLPKDYNVKDVIVSKNGTTYLKNDYIVAKIEVDKGNVYKSENTIFRDDIKANTVIGNNDVDIEAKIKRYNELVDIKNSDAWKKYREAAEKGYAVHITDDFYAVHVELPKLEKEIIEYQKLHNNNNIDLDATPILPSNRITDEKVSETLDNIIKIIDNKEGTGYGIKILNRFVETGNINLITRTGDCRNLVRLMDVDDIKKYLSMKKSNNSIDIKSFNDRTSSITELFDFFEKSGTSLNGTYGVDQGVYKSLVTYEYNGRKISYHEAKRIVNDANKRGDVLPKFRKKASREYFVIKEKIINKGFSDKNASIILSSVDDTGACSYASVCNEIFYKYRHDQKLFEDTFGYPMYKTVNGRQELNSKELLVDLYLYANDVQNGGSLIKGNDLINLSNDIDVFGRQMLKSSNQVFMTNSIIGRNEKVLDGFLKSKNKDLRYVSSQLKSCYDDVSASEFDYVAKQVEEVVNIGGLIELDIFYKPGGKNIRMISFDEKTYSNVETKSWGEGGGHSVTVTGMDNEGFIVSSWGRKYLVPFDDLKNGGSFMINSSNIFIAK